MSMIEMYVREWEMLEIVWKMQQTSLIKFWRQMVLWPLVSQSWQNVSFDLS